MNTHTRDGVCPGCGSTETLANGRIPPHNALIWTAKGLARSGTPCDGNQEQPSTVRPGRPGKAPCGTKAAKRRHHDHGESCDACGYTHPAARSVAA